MAFNNLGALSVRGYLESLLITSVVDIVSGNMGERDWNSSAISRFLEDNYHG
jgi:hypothetical protein